MTISYIAPLAAGNAIQVLLMPPAGAKRWRLLRKRADTIIAADDPGSNVVFDGDDKFIIDTTALVNGVQYFYRVFYFVSGAWVGAASRSVTVSAAFSELETDVVDIVRERLDLGFSAFVERGELQHPANHIPVLLATPAYEDAVFPLVTVHLTGEAPANRFIGEMVAPDVSYEDVGEVGSSEGWLSRFQLLIIVWCSNGDVRTAMRKALKAIVMTNLPVFESTQMSSVEASFADLDDVTTYQAPMYQATCTLTCIAPTAVEIRHPVVTTAEIHLKF